MSLAKADGFTRSMAKGGRARGPARLAGGALQKAAAALATANGIAHVAFLALFGWRVLVSGPIGKMAAIVFLALAVVGLLADAVGWALVRHGGRTRARTLGLW